MGLSKDEKSKRVLRGVKTLFFLITMLFSLLLFSAPLLLFLADTLLPSAILSASLSPSSLSLQTISSHLRNYDFRYSLIDIPLISILRSAVIICVYSFCDGPRLSRGPYLGITTLCSLLSLLFVSLKAAYVFGASSIGGDAMKPIEGIVNILDCNPVEPHRVPDHLSPTLPFPTTFPRIHIPGRNGFRGGAILVHAHVFLVLISKSEHYFRPFKGLEKAAIGIIDPTIF
ncbi:hypothetical protein HHK36_018863 [Tetracentron sinense]|uniref:Uncharacterized protein n=1 Tax=Tetracentron sinense TaxID=13715 RepID=A0A835DC91_TETSI|nr:hypothetical protein HHK36_018863 [Tetracentron sinense]